MVMSMPIPYGVMQGSTNTSHSPQPLINGSSNSSPQQQKYPTMGGEMRHSSPCSQGVGRQNKNLSSSASKKKDSSIEIIESSPSPNSSSQEKPSKGKKQQAGGKSKTSKKAEKKLNDKRDQKQRVQEELVSSTSLGARLRSKQDTVKNFGGISTPNQVASTPQKRTTRRNSSAGSRSPEQELKLNQNQQFQINHSSNQSQKNRHPQNKQSHSPQQQPLEVIIDSDNSNSTEIQECILVEDSVEEITNKNFNNLKSKSSSRSNDKQKNDKKGKAMQQEQKHLKSQHQDELIKYKELNQEQCTTDNNGYQQNFVNCIQPQSAQFPMQPYYYTYFNYNNNGFYQNACQGTFSSQQWSLPNQQHSQQQDQITHENQYFSPQKSSLTKATQMTEREASPSAVSGSVAAAARTKATMNQNNLAESQLKQTMKTNDRKSSQSPEQKKIVYTLPSHSSESESEDNHGYQNVNTQGRSSKRNQVIAHTIPSNNEVAQEDKSKRTRKHNSFYNNADFISGEYMFVSKKLTSKRSNPVQINPILKKKYQRNSTENVSSTKSLQASMMEIISQNEKSISQKTKNTFFQSVKVAEIQRAAEKAAKNTFTLTLAKRKPERKLSDDVHQGSAYFFNQPNQKLIEEQFEEDTIFLVNNNNQNVEIKVNKTPLDKSASQALKKPANGQILDPLEKIVNRFDECSRNKYFQQIYFIKDYKSGYAPIDIQNQQEKELDEMQKNEQQGEETHKQHFIRRKQTNNINLKRSCGVSYVKQPESKQENVSQIYERLPQLVFQCSNGQQKLMEHEYFYEKLYQKIFTSQNQWLLCTQFESEDESLMRDYLLYPEKRWELCKGKYFVIRNVNDIWPLFIEKYFLCIHLIYDSKELIKCPQMKEFCLEEIQNIIRYSNIHLGLLFKKSINGKKAFKKSLGEAFMGDLENHPSSRDPQAAKKKGRKAKNPNGNDTNTDKKEEEQKDDNHKKVAHESHGQEQQPHMNKTQINKFFKEVKNKLKQDKFLNELPIFKKKIEDIQKYLVPYMKKLKSSDGVMPSQEVIKSISELETNDEKVEALIEMMDFIQEQLNDEDYQIEQPQNQTKQRVSTRKESLKKSNTTTPSLNPLAADQNSEAFNKLILNQDTKENQIANKEDKNSSEIDIEIESDSKIQDGEQGKDTTPNQQQQQEVKPEQNEEKIEIEQSKESNDLIRVNDQPQDNQEVNEIKEEKIEAITEVEEKVEDHSIAQNIEVKEEKIEIEESEIKQKEETKEIILLENADNKIKEASQSNETDEMKIEEEKVDEKEIKEEKIEIEIEKENDSESQSSDAGSPKQQSALKEIERLQQSYQEVNQNAQTFEKLDALNNDEQRVALSSPVRESTSQSSSNKFIHSPSQTISKEFISIERAQNNDSTAIVTEENTIPIPNQANTNSNDAEKKEESQMIAEENKIIKKEQLICQEILNYIDKDISSKNINTLSAKLELYVEEKGWKGSSPLVKSLMSTFILYVKDQFEKLALEMMNTRFGIVREENESQLIETLKNIRFITKNSTKRRQTYENYTYLTRGKWDFNENHLSQQNVENNLFSKKEIKVNEDKLLSETEPITIAKLIDKEQGYSILKRGDFSMPLYYISTRDSFAFDLIEKISTCHFNGKSFTKTEYFFDPDNHPTNFKSFVDTFPDYRVGATLYTGFFSHQELMSIEDSCYETEVKSFQRHYFPMTAQMTCTAQKIRRTKFFFGSRYIWTRQQLAEPHSFVGAGVRQDVSAPPAWMRRKVVGPLEQAGILPNGFINSLALNVYHDGKEGLAQHFDDATRFRQPIFTFKLFSDARLSFGSQLYGFCNSAFVIPMPRGSVLKLEENSYAANGIKHCVRPCDMAGKNATIIMRQMHHKVVSEAITYDENVDLPTWISTLSSKQDAVPYGDQKEIEAEFLMRNSGQNCS